MLLSPGRLNSNPSTTTRNTLDTTITTIINNKRIRNVSPLKDKKLESNEFRSCQVSQVCRLFRCVAAHRTAKTKWMERDDTRKRGFSGKRRGDIAAPPSGPCVIRGMRDGIMSRYSPHNVYPLHGVLSCHRVSRAFNEVTLKHPQWKIGLGYPCSLTLLLLVFSTPPLFVFPSRRVFSFFLIR